MRLWILNEQYASLEMFIEYYNSSILRGESNDDFTIPANWMESYNDKLVEQTIDIDDYKNAPIIIAEIKSKKDVIWLFKQNSNTGKLKFKSSGKELNKEYMYNENSDSSGDEKGQGLSDKFHMNDMKTIAGDFKIYFQLTLCTKEFYDVDQVDQGMFRIVEEIRANEKRRSEEIKQMKIKMKQLEKERKQEEKEKLKNEQKKEDEAVDSNVKEARDQGKTVEWSYCRRNDPSKVTLACPNCKEVFYCDVEWLTLDSRLHGKICTKKFAIESYALKDDKHKYMNESTREEDEEDDEEVDNKEGKGVRMKDLYDSDEEISSQDPTKKEVKAEDDVLLSQDSDEVQSKLKSDSSLENKNAKKIKLRKLEENEDLMLDEEVVDDEENMGLDEILDLEEDPIGSQISDKKTEKEEEPEEEEDFDEDKELQEMYGKTMAEDLCSDLEESDEENKRDPYFVEKINIEWVSSNSHDVEDYETLDWLIKDMDKLSVNSSELEEDFIDDPEKDLEEDETVDQKKAKKKKIKISKQKEKRGVRFIPLPEEEARRHKRRNKKNKRKEFEEKKEKEKEVVMAKYRSEGISTKLIENEAFVKFIKSIFTNKSDNEYTKENKTGGRDENESLFSKLRDMDRFEDIITHLCSLNPPIFTGEYKKVKTCSLCKYKDFDKQMSFNLSAFLMSLNSEASQLRVMYIKWDDSYNNKFSLIGDVDFEDYETYDIPFIPKSYSMGEIKDVIKSTQNEFNEKEKQLVIVDLVRNVQINTIIEDDEMVFDLKEGDRSGIWAYEIDIAEGKVDLLDFVHIQSFDEVFKSHPRFVGINQSASCKSINIKIFKSIRMLLRQTLEKSVTKKYEKYGNNLEEIYKDYMRLDDTDYRFTLTIQYHETENVMRKLRIAKLERDGFSLDEETRKQTEAGASEQLVDVNYYKAELGAKYGTGWEDDIDKLMFQLNIDLEEEGFTPFAKAIPCLDEIDKIIVKMPPWADFTELLEHNNARIHETNSLDSKIYKFTDESLKKNIRRVLEKCSQCKKTIYQTHTVSDILLLPKYILIYANKNEEKRLVMPDRLRPFSKKCLYELKGFIVFDEKDKEKTKIEYTAYFRKEKNNWIKIFNTRKEMEHKTALRMKQNDFSTAVDLNSHLVVADNLKDGEGFPVRFEEQFLHKYLYKALIYKLIVK
jgi:hypothetical protein